MGARERLLDTRDMLELRNLKSTREGIDAATLRQGPGQLNEMQASDGGHHHAGRPARTARRGR